jgi:MFS family permease
MVCYVLLGLVQSGMVPVILPLAAPLGPAAGLTYAAFAITGIAAPFVGAWSDRHRKHRLTLACGLGLAGFALLAQALPGGIAQHMATAALVGLGVSSASTVGMMFIVEVEPKSRWDERIGVLQACIGGGQLVGLLIAGLLGLTHVGDAFLLGGLLLLLAVPLALAFAPDPVVKVERLRLAPRPVRGGDAVPMGTQRSFHRVTWRALAELRRSGLGWFLAAWLVSYTATNGLSVMFAVVMVRDYHTSATLPTTAYAIGVGCSLLLYRLVGGWDARFGPWRVLSWGLTMRALVVVMMVGLAALHTGATVLPILVCFGATQVIWPLLSVASNTLAVTLSPGHRAEDVGLLNAATAVGATIGGILGGILLRAGFVWLCTAVFCALLVALLLAWHPKVRLQPA